VPAPARALTQCENTEHMGNSSHRLQYFSFLENIRLKKPCFFAFVWQKLLSGPRNNLQKRFYFFSFLAYVSYIE
jgi:hypothetical protein